MSLILSLIGEVYEVHKTGFYVTQGTRMKMRKLVELWVAELRCILNKNQYTR